MRRYYHPVRLLMMVLLVMLSPTFQVVLATLQTLQENNQRLPVNELQTGGVVEYCQLETFSARCHHGDVVVMTTARFGRMRVGKCIDGGAFSDSIIKQDDKTIGCYADVLDYADRTCSGKETCDIAVPNHELLNTRPCFAQLTMYFEAAYICVRVADEDQSCTISVTTHSPLHIRSSSENSGSGQQRVRCGSRSHPWLLEAQTGQQVNISLLDFSGHGRQTQLDTGGLVSDDCSPAHIYYGYIVDKRNKKNISICSTSAQLRHKHVYMSAGSAVEIVLADELVTGNWNNFLLAVEAVGCSNLVPPSDAWVRRTDDEATVGCYTTRQRWNLRCHGNQWKGTVGVCTDDFIHQKLNTADSQNPAAVISHRHKDPFTEVLLIVSISFVGFAICLIIIFVGVGCVRRYKRKTCSSANRVAGNDRHLMDLQVDKSVDRPLFYETASRSAAVQA